LGSLEVGRFIAAFAVMLSHVMPYVNRHGVAGALPIFGGILSPGPLGVQYFFTLSGFVMASSHFADFGKFSSVPKFWLRRACRIYPVYWLALCIPIYYLSGALTPSYSLSLFSLDPWHDREFIPAAWSLRYEIAFYVMFGFVLLPYVGKPLLVLWACFTLWLWLPPGAVALLHLPNAYAAGKFVRPLGTDFVAFFEFYFFAGIGAGLVYKAFLPGRRVTLLLLCAALVALAGLLPLENFGVTYGPSPMFMIAVALAIATMLLALAALERHQLLQLGPWAAWLGAMSYPLYVLHEPALLVLSNLYPALRCSSAALYGLFGAILGITLILCALVTFLFDQPLQRWLRRIIRRRSVPTTNSDPAPSVA